MRYQDALQLIENDVINGALDKDVFCTLCQHADTLHSTIIAKNAANPLPANGQKRVL
jgi:hypothetical protein